MPDPVTAPVETPVDPMQDLNLIYGATRRLPISADDHDLLRKAAERLAGRLNPPADAIKVG